MKDIDHAEGSHDAIAMEKEAAPVRRKRRRGGGIFAVIIILLIAAGFGSAWYFYHKYEALKADPSAEIDAQAQEQSQQEVDDLVATVGKMIILPTDETPTVATVTNADQLRGQKFFANAEDGDKLLAYTQAMEAILYRPSINKIVEVGPIMVNQPDASTTADMTASSTASSTATSTPTTAKKK